MKKGFTLMEIMVTIVIIGVLATLSITQYTPVRERAIGREAVSALRLIAAAERIYRMEIDGNTFINCQCGCAGAGFGCCNENPGGCNFELKLNLPTQNWLYSVINATAANFTAQAVRTNGNGCQYTINQDDVEGQTANCPP